MVLQKLRVSLNFGRISHVSPFRFFFFFMKPVGSVVFCKGKEVSVDVPISLFVSINFESRKSVDSSI